MAGGVAIPAYGTSPLRAHFVHAATKPFSQAYDEMNQAHGVAVDSSGTVYVADNSNDTIVVETYSNGIYTQGTLASGLIGPTAVAVDASGNVYIADGGNNRVLKETLSNGSYIESTIGAALSNPYGVAVDADGNVYISDAGTGYGNGRLLKETLSGGSYTQNVIANFVQPFGISVDGSGNVYVADRGANKVFKETLSDGSYLQSMITSNVIAPHHVITDGQGNAYIADAFNHRVLLEAWNSGSGTYSESIFATMDTPMGLEFDANGDLWVADYGIGIVVLQRSLPDFGAVNARSTSENSRITFAFDTPGSLGSISIMTQGASGLDFADARSGSCAAGAYNGGDVCTVDASFTPSVAGTRYGAVLLKDASGNVAATAYLIGTGIGPQVAFQPPTGHVVAGSGLSGATGVAVDGSGNVYIADSGNNRILKETFSAGAYSESVLEFPSSLSYPNAVAVDQAGNLFIVDTFAGRVLKEAPSGSGFTETIVATGLLDPKGVAIDASGNVYIADSIAHTVLKETLSNGSYSESVIAGNGLDHPYSVAVDADGSVFISDTGNNRVLKETLSGNSYVESEIANDLNGPSMLVTDGKGNVYIANTLSHEIVRLTRSGNGYGRTTLPITGLARPYGVAVDGSGNVYIADTDNDRVVKEAFAETPTLEFGAIDAGSSSSPQVVTVENIGNAGMLANGDGIEVPEGFTLVAGDGTPADCQSPALAVGASCNLNIAFAPESGGDFSGSQLLLIDNALNQNFSTQFITLNGTGNEAAPPPVATQLVFASSIPANFPLGSNLGTVTVNAEDGDSNLVASFEDNVELTIEDSDENVIYDEVVSATEGIAIFDLSETSFDTTGVYFIAATSSGLTAAEDTFEVISASSAIVAGEGMSGQSALFNSTAVGESSVKSVTLNITASITLSSITAGGDYEITNAGQCALDTALSSGDSCTVTVRFTPTAPGQRWFPLVVSDDAGIKYSFGLAGFATGAAVSFPPGWASLFAGNGDAGYYGDGGPATEAALSWPQTLTRDGAGNFYIADSDNNVIRKIDANGIITTVAGNGDCDENGDGGPATSAALCEPSDVAVDAAGNLYITDYDNSVVRKVDINGVITRFAGTGQDSFSGDGGPATSATLAYPTSLVADPNGDIFIADGDNLRIRKVDTRGIITTYAGNGDEAYYGDGEQAVDAAIGYPWDVTIDSQGNIYVSDSSNDVVRKVDGEGRISTVAGTGESGYGGDNGPAIEAQLNMPAGLSVSSAGELFIADAFNCVVRKVDLQGLISTVAGSSCAGEIMASRPSMRKKSVRIRQNGMSRSARQKKALARFSREIFGPPITQVPFYFPVDVAVDPTGNLFVLDAASAIVAKGNLETMPPVDMGSVEVGQTGEPVSVTVGNTGNASLEFSQISVAENFELEPQQGDCAVGTAVSAASACTLHVSFAPTAAAGITGSVVLTDNGNNSPQTVNFAGEGLAAPTAPDFSMTMATGSVAVISGSGGTVGLTITPTGGFAGTISLSCSGLPAHSTCSFSPPSLDALGDNSSLSSTMTILTGVAAIPARMKSGASLLGLWVSLPGLGMLGLLFMPGNLSRKRDWLRLIAFFVLALSLIGLATACGSSHSTPPSNPLTPAGRYSVTLTASSGATSHSAVITLVVQ